METVVKRNTNAKRSQIFAPKSGLETPLLINESSENRNENQVQAHNGKKRIMMLKKLWSYRTRLRNK